MSSKIGRPKTSNRPSYNNSVRSDRSQSDSAAIARPSSGKFEAKPDAKPESKLVKPNKEQSKTLPRNSFGPNSKGADKDVVYSNYNGIITVVAKPKVEEPAKKSSPRLIPQVIVPSEILSSVEDVVTLSSPRHETASQARGPKTNIPKPKKAWEETVEDKSTKKEEIKLKAEESKVVESDKNKKKPKVVVEKAKTPSLDSSVLTPQSVFVPPANLSGTAKLNSPMSNQVSHVQVVAENALLSSKLKELELSVQSHAETAAENLRISSKLQDYEAENKNLLLQVVTLKDSLQKSEDKSTSLELEVAQLNSHIKNISAEGAKQLNELKLKNDELYLEISSNVSKIAELQKSIEDMAGNVSQTASSNNMTGDRILLENKIVEMEMKLSAALESTMKASKEESVAQEIIRKNQQLFNETVHAKDIQLSLSSQKIKQLEKTNRDLDMSLHDTQNKVTTKAARKAMEEEKMQFQQTIDDLKFVLLYGDSLKDKEMDVLKNSIATVHARHEADMTKKTEENNLLRQQLRQIQEHSVENWMFNGKFDFATI